MSKYVNIIIMGDKNIDIHDNKAIGFKELAQFMNMFGLKNLIKDKTCFFKGHESSIDVILTNKHRQFYPAKTFELGVSDCHEMIFSLLRVNLPRLRKKYVMYRSFKKFKLDVFLEKLQNSLVALELITTDTNLMYDNLIDILVTLLDIFAPLKKNV